MNSKKHVDLDNAREADQADVMRQIVEDGGCPFCPENFQKYNKQEILKEGEHWLLTTNQWPYEFTRAHFLLIYKSHAEDLREMDPESGKELLKLAQWAQDKFEIPGGGLIMRFGDTNHSAGSVQHIHAQLISPDLEADGYRSVKVTLGKSPEKLGR